jgi:hypothetical protein
LVLGLVLSLTPNLELTPQIVDLLFEALDLVPLAILVGFHADNLLRQLLDPLL